MTGRHLREWPRLVAACVVAAVLLVLVGVLVASAGSGGTKTVTAKAAAAVHPAPDSPTAAPATSNADKQQVAKLRDQLKRQSAELAATRHALAASQRRTRCWRTKARHPKKERALHCPTGSLTQ